MSTLLELKGVSKAFKVKKGLLSSSLFHALRSITLSVNKGEVLGIVGESGSGKTTLGKLILRLEEPSQGHILFEGRDIFSLGREYTKKVSVVFQDPRSSLNPRMKVREIVEEPLLVHGYKDRRGRVEEVVGKVRLPFEFLERKPEDLSGGQRQRVAIARAIALKPSLIVADEPTSALDVSVQWEILTMFRSLKEEGIAFLFITHDIRVVERIADRIAVIYGGILMELGNKEDILGNPLHPYTKFLLSNVPVKHPRDRRDDTFTEEEYEVPDSGCPFAPRCPEYRSECSTTLRRVEINGRLVNCNLY